jgi:hypothetical protein
MATTVAAIAARAFDQVATKLTGVIQTGTLSRTASPAYDATTGVYAGIVTTSTCRVLVDTQTPVADVFPGYAEGPSGVLLYLEGLTTAPAENDTIAYGSLTRTIKAVSDIVAAGTFFAVMAE